MEQFITQQNIERFERLLSKLTDPTQRSSVEGLLEAEKQKLKALLDPPFLTEPTR